MCRDSSPMAAAAPPPDAASIYVELYVAVAELRARCLYSAATWAAEALAALPEGVAEAAAGTAAAAAAAAPAAAAAHPLLLQGRCYLEDKVRAQEMGWMTTTWSPRAATLHQQEDHHERCWCCCCCLMHTGIPAGGTCVTSCTRASCCVPPPVCHLACRGGG